MRTTIAILLVFVQITLCGCAGHARMKRLEASQIKKLENERIAGVTTLKGEDVVFDENSAVLRNQVLYARVKQAAWQMPVAEVERFWVERREISAIRTVGLVAAVVVVGLVVTIAIVAATKGSCPFVYSWDGERYVFDTEPDGGAISRGLERDDFAELSHLRADHGEYRLMITNEVDETQYTNSMELWAIDHAPGVRIVAGEQGKLYTLAQPLEPVSARDDSGRDLLRWLRRPDRLIWEPPAQPARSGSLRQEIVLEFPKPPDARMAKLESRTATGLWGSYMVREMVALRGREIPAWYREIDSSQAARDELRDWNLREELWWLKVYVEEPEGWVVRGVMPGGGPLISPARVIPLDVSRARGGRLRIRICPPAGYWAFDSFAVDYTPESPLQVQRIPPASAREPGGREVLRELLAADDGYYEMPAIGDRAFLAFPAPPPQPSMERTVFLHTRGWYRLHLDQTREPDTAALKRLLATPGAGAEFGAERYRRWNLQHAR
jgi:hypothetical protein